jgi:hypothetical protein
MIMWFLFLLLLTCCIIFIDLNMLNHPCIPWMKLAWSYQMIFLICCSIRFAIILLKIFYWYLLRSLPCSYPFWIYPCMIEWAGKCSFPFYFMEKFKQCWY